MFKSFFFAGFECATGYNEKREWIDQVRATHHDLHAEEDYRRLKEVGICAAREAIRWPLIDKDGAYDFTSVRPFLQASNKYGIEVVWDLFHYGYPEGLDLFSPEFVRRFASYCRATAEEIAANYSGTLYFTPVNEPSYFSWAAAEVGKFAPHLTGQGYQLKLALCRAAIAGINAIREVCPDARMVNADPLCHVVPPLGQPEKQRDCDGFNQSVVFQSWDMLSGRLHPELGGSSEHLDIVGINYYWTNQWELGGKPGPLASDDRRRVPLSELIQRVYERYGREMLITETSHVDEHRANWVREVAAEAEKVLELNVPLRGICLYPILGMPEWHSQDEWTLLGLWDVSTDTKLRSLCQPMFEALQDAHRLNAHLNALPESNL